MTALTWSSSGREERLATEIRSQAVATVASVGTTASLAAKVAACPDWMRVSNAFVGVALNAGVKRGEGVRRAGHGCRQFAGRRPAPPIQARRGRRRSDVRITSDRPA